MRPDRALAGRHFEAMGTTCSVFAVDQPEARLVAAESWVHSLAARLTRFTADSELTQLNAAAGRWVNVSEDLESVLRAALDAYAMSSGLVNAAILPSMLAIGYRQPLALGGGKPHLEEMPAVRALPGVLQIRERRAKVALGCGIDLGGIAKGWMADRLCRALGPNALVNLGGDLRAVGSGPNGQGWPVSVAGACFGLRDQGAATSSTRRRQWGGVHHLIDPRTGQIGRAHV